MASTEKTKPSTNTKNGNAPTKPAETGENKDREHKTRGATPTMPLCVVYRLPSQRVVAEIIAPLTGQRYRAEGKGMGSAKGELEDSGFVLGPMKDAGPAWISERELISPENEIIGYCAIAGFPLPPQ